MQGSGHVGDVVIPLMAVRMASSEYVVVCMGSSEEGTSMVMSTCRDVGVSRDGGLSSYWGWECIRW